jgi:drug/metabolite transporter (DMT)-like permease
LGTVRATNFLYLNPVIAIASSAIVLGERITWIAIAGALLILAGMLYVDRHRQR